MRLPSKSYLPEVKLQSKFYYRYFSEFRRALCQAGARHDEN